MEYLDQFMDLPRLYAFYYAWQEAPPVEVMVAAYLGYKPKAAADAPENNAEEMANLMDGLPKMQLPKILTPAEYLAQKAAGDAHGGQ